MNNLPKDLLISLSQNEKENIYLDIYTGKLNEKSDENISKLSNKNSKVTKSNIEIPEKKKLGKSEKLQLISDTQRLIRENDNIKIQYRPKQCKTMREMEEMLASSMERYREKKAAVAVPAPGKTILADKVILPTKELSPALEKKSVTENDQETSLPFMDTTPRSSNEIAPLKERLMVNPKTTDSVMSILRNQHIESPVHSGLVLLEPVKRLDPNHPEIADLREKIDRHFSKFATVASKSCKDNAAKISGWFELDSSMSAADQQRWNTMSARERWQAYRNVLLRRATDKTRATFEQRALELQEYEQRKRDELEGGPEERDGGLSEDDYEWTEENDGLSSGESDSEGVDDKIENEEDDNDKDEDCGDHEQDQLEDDEISNRKRRSAHQRTMIIISDDEDQNDDGDQNPSSVDVDCSSSIIPTGFGTFLDGINDFCDIPATPITVANDAALIDSEDCSLGFGSAADNSVYSAPSHPRDAEPDQDKSVGHTVPLDQLSDQTMILNPSCDQTVILTPSGDHTVILNRSADSSAGDLDSSLQMRSKHRNIFGGCISPSSDLASTSFSRLRALVPDSESEEQELDEMPLPTSGGNDGARNPGGNEPVTSSHDIDVGNVDIDEPESVTHGNAIGENHVVTDDDDSVTHSNDIEQNHVVIDDDHYDSVTHGNAIGENHVVIDDDDSVTHSNNIGENHVVINDGHYDSVTHSNDIWQNHVVIDDESVTHSNDIGHEVDEDNDESVVSDEDESVVSDDEIDEEEMQRRAEVRHRSLVDRDLLDEEAALSGSDADEWGPDEDETGLDRWDDEEEPGGEREVLPSERRIRQQIGKLHHRLESDRDARELRLLKERYLEDGELDLPHLEARQRRFGWAPIPGLPLPDDATGLHRDADDTEQDQEELEQQDHLAQEPVAETEEAVAKETARLMEKYSHALAQWQGARDSVQAAAADKQHARARLAWASSSVSMETGTAASAIRKCGSFMNKELKLPPRETGSRTGSLKARMSRHTFSVVKRPRADQPPADQGQPESSSPKRRK